MKVLAIILAAISLIGSALGQDRKAHPPLLIDASAGLNAAPLDQATKEAAITPPVAAAMRAKFPRIPGHRIDALSFINQIVNQMITYQSDTEHYGLSEHWVMMPADNKGDCEDYVLSKYRILQLAGFPTVSHARVRSVMAGVTGHALLELRMPETGEIMFMDNDGSGTLWTRAELVAKGYRFFEW